MSTRTPTPIRVGLIGLPLCGLLYGIGALLRGEIISPIHPLVVDRQAFAEWVTAPGFTAGWLLIIFAVTADVFGIVALYAFLYRSRVARLAFAGMALTVIGDVLYEAYLGVHAFTWPQAGALYLRGIEAAYEVVDIGYNTPAATVVGLMSSLGYTIGSIVIAVALWRSGFFARWAALAYGVHGPILGIPIMPFALELLGTVLLLVSGTAIVARVWRRDAADDAGQAEQAPSPMGSATRLAPAAPDREAGG